MTFTTPPDVSSSTLTASLGRRMNGKLKDEKWRVAGSLPSNSPEDNTHHTNSVPCVLFSVPEA